jgi:hypothetical protein
MMSLSRRETRLILIARYRSQNFLTPQTLLCSVTVRTDLL